METEQADAATSSRGTFPGSSPRSGVKGEVAPVLVLGLGNLLLKDDGVGLELLRRLRERRADVVNESCSVEYVDGGTQGVALLGQLAGRSAMLILDAVSWGAEPGCVKVMRDPLDHVAPQGVGAHGANASGLLASAMLVGDMPEHSVVVGIGPAELVTEIGLSGCVEAAIPEALDAAERLLDELCVRLKSEERDTQGVASCTS